MYKRMSSKDLKRLDTDTLILLFTFYIFIIKMIHNTVFKGKESQIKALSKIKSKMHSNYCGCPPGGE